MADISVTAANVAPVSGPYADGVAAVAITAGQAVYQLAAGTWGLAQRDGTQIEAGLYGLGIALNTAGIGQPLKIGLAGSDVTCGGTVAVGTVYTLSATAGGWTADAAASTNYNSVFALGKSTTRLRMVCTVAEAANA